MLRHYRFLRVSRLCAAAALACVASAKIDSDALAADVLATEASPEPFHVWTAGCAHVGVDSLYGIEPIRHAIRQSEGFWSFLTPTEQKLAGIPPAFDWDIMLNLGDFATGQFPPSDGEGRAVVDQYSALEKHAREDVYSLAGNHDGGYYDQGPGTWFRRWIDPLGEHPETSGVHAERRPFPIEGTWERYSFQAGNVLFLVLADRNDVASPVGRGHSRDRGMGGFPAGAVTRETFEWWKEQVLANQDKIIITAHHHVLRDTTARSTVGGGGGAHARGAKDFAGASFLYYIIENEDPDAFEYTMSTPETPGPFETFLATFEQEHGRPAIDLWLGGHTHSQPGEVVDGRSLAEQRWGVTFLQVAALTHRNTARTPMSRLLRFEPGSDALAIDLYIHGARYYSHAPPAVLKKLGVDLERPPAPEGAIQRNGWFEPEARVVPLRHAFEAPPADKRPGNEADGY